MTNDTEWASVNFKITTQAIVLCVFLFTDKNNQTKAIVLLN